MKPRGIDHSRYARLLEVQFDNAVSIRDYCSGVLTRDMAVVYIGFRCVTDIK